jgi:hypothetical protein
VEGGNVSEIELDAAQVIEASREYVSARYALRGSDAAGMLEALVRLDWAWHELTIALHEHDPECEGCGYVYAEGELGPAPHYRVPRWPWEQDRTIEDTKEL